MATCRPVLLLLLLSLSCQFVLSQNGDGNFATGIASAILNAIFPDLSPQQNSLLNAPQSQPLPQGQNNFFGSPRTQFQGFGGSSPGGQFQQGFGGSSPGVQSPGRQAVAKSPPTILNNGVNGNWPPSPLTPKSLSSNLPPVDFIGGFPPTFSGLTNPDYQNSFLFPNGIQGRTDLPASYVYPFAQPGSLITPGSRNGEMFALGDNNKLPVNAAPQVQSQTSQAQDPRYLFTGKPTGFSLSPALASLFNPLNASANFASGLQKSPLSQEVPKTSGDGEPPADRALAKLYKKLKNASDNSPPAPTTPKPDFSLLQQLFSPLVGFSNHPVPVPPPSGAGQSPPVNSVQPVTRNNIQSLPSDGNQWSGNQFASAPQQFPQFQPGPAQPAFAVQAAPGQPVLVQPQIFNQIFPQSAQFGQLGSAVPQTFIANPVGNLSPGKKQLAPIDNDPDVYGNECPQCVTPDIAKLSGPWVQVYGNPDAMRTIYSTISTLQGLYGDGTLESSSQSVQPVCVGFQFSRPHPLYDKSLQNGLESTLNLYFRDDTPNRQLHEVLGRIRQDPSNPKRISIKLPGFSVPMCAVKIGPSSSTMYSYAILTETIGTNRCQSYHVLARDSDTFFRDYNRNVAEFLKSEVESGKAKPLSVLPHPDLCQLQISPQILRKA